MSDIASLEVVRVTSAVTGDTLLELPVDSTVEASKDFALLLQRRVASAASVEKMQKTSRFCTMLLLGQELLPEGRSFESLGRPNEVKVAFQRLVHQHDLAKRLWHGAANGDLCDVKGALKAFQDPDVQDDHGESAVWKA